MRRNLFLGVLLLTIAAVTAVLTPLSAAIALRKRARDRSRNIVRIARRRIRIARYIIARRIRAAAT